MENSDKKKEPLGKQNTLLQNTLLATFNSHYGAMLTKKKVGSSCVLYPVPRFLSSSCGICAVIENFSLQNLINIAGEFLEAVYTVTSENKNHFELKKYNARSTVSVSQILPCKNNIYIKIYDSEDTI